MSEMEGYGIADRIMSCYNSCMGGRTTNSEGEKQDAPFVRRMLYWVVDRIVRKKVTGTEKMINDLHVVMRILMCHFDGIRQYEGDKYRVAIGLLFATLPIPIVRGFATRYVTKKCHHEIKEFKNWESKQDQVYTTQELIEGTVAKATEKFPSVLKYVMIGCDKVLNLTFGETKPDWLPKELHNLSDTAADKGWIPVDTLHKHKKRHNSSMPRQISEKSLSASPPEDATLEERFCGCGEACSCSTPTVLFPGRSKIPDVVVATEQKMCTGTSGINTTIYKNGGSIGLHPRIMFAFTVKHDIKRKAAQLFTYINNSSSVIGDHMQFFVIGVVVRIPMEHGTPSFVPWLAVNAYMMVSPENSAGEQCQAKLATITIFDGPWNADSVTNLFRVIHFVLSLPMSAYNLPVSGLIPYSRVRENVLLPVGNETDVFKIYDYLGHREGSRRSKGNIKFIQGCKEIVKTSEGITVIKYPNIQGEHYAERTVAFVGVLRHLAEVHRAGWLHLDIKAGNIIFNNTDGTASRLIDFDFANNESNARYPEMFNVAITDGVRHPEARGRNYASKEHDWYAMAGVMKLFISESVQYQELWEEWCTRVTNGLLEETANEIEATNPFSLQLRDDVPCEHTSNLVLIGKRKADESAADDK